MGEAIRGLLRSSSSRHRPRQLAAAIAMGVMCGLIPKLSLTFCLLGSICILLPIHVPLGALVCVICSMAITTLAPAAGRLGIWSLTNPLFRDLWLGLDALPLVPWLGLHNSVIHGSLLIGLCAWLPVYLLSQPVSRWIAPRQLPPSVKIVDFDFSQELRPVVATYDPQAHANHGEPIEVQLLPTRMQFQATHDPATHDPLAAQDPIEQAGHESDICRELEQLLENCNSEQSIPMSVEQVVERASQIAQYVDDLLTASESNIAPVHPGAVHLLEYAGDNLTPSQLTDAILDEAIGYFPDQRPGLGSEESSSQRSAAISPPTETPRSTKLHQAKRDREMLRRHEQHSSVTVASPSPHAVNKRRPVGDVRQQEALRYLLHHLKAFKDKV